MYTRNPRKIWEMHHHTSVNVGLSMVAKFNVNFKMFSQDELQALALVPSP
jgi:hypothetical protein